MNLSPIVEAVLVCSLRQYIKQPPFSYIRKLTQHEILPSGPYFSLDIFTNLFIYNTLTKYNIYLKDYGIWVKEHSKKIGSLENCLYKQITIPQLSDCSSDLRNYLNSVESKISKVIDIHTTSPYTPPKLVFDSISEYKEVTSMIQAQSKGQALERILSGKLLQEVVDLYIFILEARYGTYASERFVVRYFRYVILGVIFSTAIDWIKDKDEVSVPRKELHLIAKLTYSELIKTEMISKALIKSALVAHSKYSELDVHAMHKINLPIYYPLLKEFPDEVSEKDISSYFLCKKLCDDIGDSCNFDASSAIATHNQLKILEGHLKNIKSRFEPTLNFQEMNFIYNFYTHEIESIL